MGKVYQVIQQFRAEYKQVDMFYYYVAAELKIGTIRGHTNITLLSIINYPHIVSSSVI